MVFKNLYNVGNNYYFIFNYLDNFFFFFFVPTKVNLILKIQLSTYYHLTEFLFVLYLRLILQKMREFNIEDHK